MKKQPILIDKTYVVKAIKGHRETNDVLAFHEQGGKSLALEVNHVGGLYIMVDGIEVEHHIGAERCADAYYELYKEMFDGK